MSDKSKKSNVSNSLQFLFGGTAAVVTGVLVHPLDVIKMRMQIINKGDHKKNPHGLHKVVHSLLHNEGFLGLFNGLGAGLLRQLIYSTTRLGIYTSLVGNYRFIHNDEPPLTSTCLFAIIAGTIGSFIGNPSDVALIRMSVDGSLPTDQRRNYKNVFNAINRIHKEEGLLALWKGATATMSKAIVVNVMQLSAYSQLKHFFLIKYNMKDDFFLHFGTSAISGFLTAFTSMPFDMAKTRLQNQKTKEYRNISDVLVRVSQREGILALWKGFLPYYARVGSNTIVIFVILEQIYKFYFQIMGMPEDRSNL